MTGSFPVVRYYAETRAIYGVCAVDSTLISTSLPCRFKTWGDLRGQQTGGSLRTFDPGGIAVSCFQDGR